MIDPLSGHGTFIAGLVHQACPDADIVAWRIVPSDGPIAQSDLLVALYQIAELAKRYREKKSPQPIDVLNLSMGYYHEKPDDALTFDPLMTDILQTLADNGVVVVTSAGNDCTDRPCFPAAFSSSTGPLPVLSVGALNPNGTTDALFSNVGDWVTDYARGAAVFSTMPTTFQGGLEPVARWEYDGRQREALDPDDYHGGFALWSGTSFAAPVVAGKVAMKMIDNMEQTGQVDDAATAVQKSQDAVQAFRAESTHDG
jgi:subtilisin family serine protease